MNHTRVLKLGGSLLSLPDWPNRLRRWLTQHPCQLNLLLCGGGEIVEAVRGLDAAVELPPEFVHWICIDLLSSTTRIAGQLLPEFPIVTDGQALAQVLEQRKRGYDSTTSGVVNYLVEVSSFYSPGAPFAMLTEDWNTTSDSLAAYLACVVEADELVLLKSVSQPAGAETPAAWCALGIVDANFSRVIGNGCAARIVNLKGDQE